MPPSICLGTAQFGMDYGVTNEIGQTSKYEVKKILKICKDKNIKFLDTAQAYGNSEEIIGLSLPNKNKFKVISKLSTNNELDWNQDTVKSWEYSIQRTLNDLRLSSINSFLIHNPKNLSPFQKEIVINWLNSLRERNIVKRIGISIYEPKELEDFQLECLQIIQLPLSIYDQRMLNNGTIKYLNEKGIDIHIRSIFLQGLILQDSEDWPSFLTKEFKEHHNKLIKYCQSKGICILDFVIAFIKKLKFVEAAVIGINSTEHLNSILESWSKNIADNFVEGFNSSWNNKNDLDPRLWPSPSP